MTDQDNSQQRHDKVQAEKLAKEQFEADFTWLMSHTAGRRIVHGMLAKTGIYKQSFTGNSETYFREGRRSVGLDLLADVNTITPEQYLPMLEEQRK